MQTDNRRRKNKLSNEQSMRVKLSDKEKKSCDWLHAMDKIFISDMKVYGILGVHDWERKKTRPIILNIIIFTDITEAAMMDDYEKSVDYSDLAKKIRAHAESVARMTVEALANDLAEICLAMPRVQKVIVRVDKPGAVENAVSVGVEIERIR
jgi:FolB domain-containing protein